MIVNMVTLLHRNPCTDALTIQRLLRHMATSMAVIPHAHFWMRPLQLWFLLNFKPTLHSQDKLLTVTK